MTMFGLAVFLFATGYAGGEIGGEAGWLIGTCVGFALIILWKNRSAKR